GPIDAERGIGLLGELLTTAEAQVMTATRTDRRALEHRGLAVRAQARRAGLSSARGAHTARGVPFDSSKAAGRSAACLSSQPNSTCPRMREPAATVIEAALTSPTMMPVDSTSTCLAASILPCSSPPTTTTLARTWPSRRAPASMRKLPSTCTSPLNRPAMRTSPAPEILPSMVSSAAISDSTAADARGAAGARRRFSAGGGGSGARSTGLACSSVTLGLAATGVPPAAGPEDEPVSFQSAMSGSSVDQVKFVTMEYQKGNPIGYGRPVSRVGDIRPAERVTPHA